MLAAGTVLQGRYRIVQSIGGGGMGTVYLTEDAHLAGQRRALKEMSPNQLPAQDRSWAVNAFRQEAQLLASLNHQGLVHVTDYFTEFGNWYLVMDYVPGQTLEEWLTQYPSGLPVNIALNYVQQLCDVLGYLHHQNPPVVFRDLKPGNIMVTPQGEVKLIDFGIARFFKPGQSHNTVNLGTPGYASPEHGGKGQTDPRSDIYSLGVVLHQLLTGYDPTAPNTGYALPPYQLPSARSINSTVPPQVEAVIQCATQFHPAQRFRSVDDFRQALISPLTAPQFAATPPTATQSGASYQGYTQTQKVTTSSSQRQPVPIIITSVSMLLILVVGVIALSRPSQPAPSGLGNVTGYTPPPSTVSQVPARAAPPTEVPNVAVTESPAQPPVEVAPPAAQPTAEPPAPTLTRKVAFARGAVGCAGVVVLDIDTGVSHSYSYEANTAEPAWAPDGQRFVASSGRCSGGDQALVVFSIDSGQQRIVVSGGNNIDPDWGHDDRIYFVRGATTSNGEIYSVRSDGSDQRATGLSGRQPTLSPDGTRLAYMAQSGSNWRIYIAQARGDGTFGSARQLPFPAAPGGVHARMPHWTWDSVRVIFNVTDRNFDSVALGTVDVNSNGDRYWDGRTTNNQRLARPSCGADDYCVANEVEGGLWLMRESGGNFSLDRALTNDASDWGADIYP